MEHRIVCRYLTVDLTEQWFYEELMAYKQKYLRDIKFFGIQYVKDWTVIMLRSKFYFVKIIQFCWSNNSAVLVHWFLFLDFVLYLLSNFKLTMFIPTDETICGTRRLKN